jgi:hypothetical protein
MRYNNFPVELSESDAIMARVRSSSGKWRAVVALFTALAFVALLITAASHHHNSSIEDHDCAICSVAIQKIANTNLVDLPQMVSVLVSYAPFIAESRAIAHVTSVFLPPSCGPPAHSVATL